MWKTTALLAGLLGATSGFAQEETKVELRRDLPINAASLEQLLRIRSVSGTFQVPPQNSFRLRLDLYRGGKLIKSLGSGGVGGATPRRHGQFLVQIIDLDYLPLGDARPGHWRINSRLSTSDEPAGRGVVSSKTADVAKDDFDASPRTGRIGRFAKTAPGPDGTPLFYSASGQVRSVDTLAQLLEQNPDSDILVGVLETK